MPRIRALLVEVLPEGDPDAARAQVEDGDSDAVVLLSEGTVVLYKNERGGVFQKSGPPLFTGALAIAVGDTNPVAEVKAMVGKPVGVVVSGRTIVAIGRRPGRWIVCYIPVPDLMRNVREDLRGALLDRYVKLNVIPTKAAQGLKSLGR